MFPAAYNAFKCLLAPDVLTNVSLSAQQCAGGDDSVCIAICANTDLAGIGVRVAFYVQSVMNALLVMVSPEDSVASAWGGTLLTASLIVAAIVQKVHTSITLHHSILVLNFATLACISSLAVAPTLPIWRLHSVEYHQRALARHDATAPLDIEGTGDAKEKPTVTLHRREIFKAARDRERTIITFAIFSQVVLQWAWGIILFVSPSYAQISCSSNTVLLFFMKPFWVSHINNHEGFYIWPLWLLFCLGSTLVLTCSFVVSSSLKAHDARLYSNTPEGVVRHDSWLKRTATVLSHSAQTIGWWRRISEVIGLFLPSKKDRQQQFIFASNIICLCLWTLFVISSEWQIQLNCIFSGENDFQGFGQITALLLSFAPLWGLTAAVYKYPALRRRLKAKAKSLSQNHDRELSHHHEGTKVCSTSTLPFDNASIDAAVPSPTVVGDGQSEALDGLSPTRPSYPRGMTSRTMVEMLSPETNAGYSEEDDDEYSHSDWMSARDEIGSVADYSDTSGL